MADPVVWYYAFGGGGYSIGAQRGYRQQIRFEDFDFRVNEDSLSDWQRVEGCLWNVMDQFEEAYGDKEITRLDRQPTSEEVITRFRRIAKEYDSPCVLVRCANCQDTRKVSKFYISEQSVRCRCGGYCIAVGKLLRTHDGLS